MATGRQQGFTLIELMITVAVVAILAAIAYPTYQNAMVKNRRAAAQAYLADVAQREQQYLMDNRAYTDSPTTLKATPSSDVGSYYDISITAAASTPPAFTATATPRSGSAQASDGILRITQSGQKTRVTPDGVTLNW
ncbi:MAG: type IV pilin protein [Ramlibacter sp.]